MKVQPLGPDAEVLGGAINGMIAAVNRDSIMLHLKRLGMTDIQPDKWYPKQMYIDLWNSLIDEGGGAAGQNLVSIGITIANTAWPPEADEESFDTIITTWEDAFNAVNRGADRGYVRAIQQGNKRYTVYCCTPDPDDLNYGVVYGICKRFLPKGSHFTVSYDEDIPRRDHGGEETIIHIDID